MRAQSGSWITSAYCRHDGGHKSRSGRPRWRVLGCGPPLEECICLKVLLICALICVSGCSWFGAKRPPLADPTELVVTGAPGGAVIFVDSVNTGAAPHPAVRPQVIRVAPGAHEVEVHVGGRVVYREETYVSRGEQRVVTVLSGSSP